MIYSLGNIKYVTECDDESIRYYFDAFDCNYVYQNGMVIMEEEVSTNILKTLSQSTLVRKNKLVRLRQERKERTLTRDLQIILSELNIDAALVAYALLHFKMTTLGTWKIINSYIPNMKLI